MSFEEMVEKAKALVLRLEPMDREHRELALVEAFIDMKAVGHDEALNAMHEAHGV